jgi:hypothetical protein
MAGRASQVREAERYVQLGVRSIPRKLQFDYNFWGTYVKSETNKKGAGPGDKKASPN